MSEDKPARKGRTWRTRSPFFVDSASNFNARNAEPTPQYVYMQTQEEIMRTQDEILRGLREQQEKRKERELARLSDTGTVEGTVVTNTSSLMTAHGHRGFPEKKSKEKLPPPTKNADVAKGDLKQKLDRGMDKKDASEISKRRTISDEKPNYKSEVPETSSETARSIDDAASNESVFGTVVTNAPLLRGVPKKHPKETLPPPPKYVVVAKGQLKQKLDRGMDSYDRLRHGSRKKDSSQRPLRRSFLKSSITRRHSFGSYPLTNDFTEAVATKEKITNRLHHGSRKKDSSRRPLSRSRRKNSITSHSSGSYPLTNDFAKAMATKEKNISYPWTNAFTEAMATFLADSHANIAGFTSEEMEHRIVEIVWEKFRNSSQKSDAAKLCGTAQSAIPVHTVDQAAELTIDKASRSRARKNTEESAVQKTLIAATLQSDAGSVTKNTTNNLTSCASLGINVFKQTEMGEIEASATTGVVQRTVLHYAPVNRKQLYEAITAHEEDATVAVKEIDVTKSVEETPTKLLHPYEIAAHTASGDASMHIADNSVPQVPLKVQATGQAAEVGANEVRVIHKIQDTANNESVLHQPQVAINVNSETGSIANIVPTKPVPQGALIVSVPKETLKVEANELIPMGKLNDVGGSTMPQPLVVANVQSNTGSDAKNTTVRTFNASEQTVKLEVKELIPTEHKEIVAYQEPSVETVVRPGSELVMRDENNGWVNIM